MTEYKYLVCPYQPSHVIIAHRMPRHLLRCKKSYKGPPLETCDYCAVHLVPLGKMEEHLKTCQEFHYYNTPLYRKLADKLKGRAPDQNGSAGIQN